MQGQTTPVVVQHPDEHPWEPVYLRTYFITNTEINTVQACQSKKVTHNCDMAFIAVVREESCIPEDFVINRHSVDEGAFTCPLLLDGYSVYETADTSVDVLSLKYHVSNIPGLDVPVYILPRDLLLEWWNRNVELTYGNLFMWEEDYQDVYRGYATEFSEYHTNDVRDGEVGSFSVVAKGILEGGHTFTVRIREQESQEEEGPDFEPILWEIDIEYAQDDSSDDSSDDELEEGGLAGVIVGSTLFGALVGSFLVMTLAWRRPADERPPAAATASTPEEPKPVEPTESAHD